MTTKSSPSIKEDVDRRCHLSLGFPSGAPATENSTVADLTWRCVDIGLAALMLIALLPVLLGVALAVKASSRGPVIFRQRRVGRHGELFEVYKFRTMIDNAESALFADHEQFALYLSNDFKLPDDPRITPIGKVLRRASLDELPQLVNILVGQMSLVGVRPLLEDELALRPAYDQALYTHRRPGLTGLWQVEGRSTVQFADRIELDRRYLEQWSVWTNLKILLKTPLVIARAKGAH